MLRTVALFQNWLQRALKLKRAVKRSVALSTEINGHVTAVRACARRRRANLISARESARDHPSSYTGGPFLGISQRLAWN